MRKTMACVVLATICLSATTLLCAPPPQADQQQSLYKRLGGFDALAAVTDDFIGRMVANPQLKRFFTGFNEHSLQRIREHIVDFLCQATGGPCKYHGEDMKTAHTGLKITDADWDAAVKDLNATLDKFKVPQKERGEVLGAVSGLKGDIVGH
jgi:hemoglobin